MRRVLVALVALTVAGGCKLPQALTDYCPDDPTTEPCPGGPCAGPFMCVSHCLRHYPDRVGVPASGMGSWCDDARLPPSYGAFCVEHPDVIGCDAYCAARPTECSAADGDGDADADGDVDGDADADGDPDVGCRSDDECTDAAASFCDRGVCRVCAASGHCRHIPGLPACSSTGCVQCTAEDDRACEAPTPHCLAAEQRCIACRDGADCTTAAAARCLDNECVPCAASPDCASVDGLPVCDEGTCVECLLNADCAVGTLCNYTEKRCVEACRSCTGPTDCAPLGEGFVCMMDWPDPYRQHCFQQAETCERPWRWVDLAGGLCMPPASTSCLGVLELGETCDPAAPATCGEDGSATDAYCTASGTCSYYCTTDLECPVGTTCTGVPLACRP